MRNLKVGLAVLFFSSTAYASSRAIAHSMSGEPMAATVAHVIHENMVNLSVLDHNGEQFNVTSVPIYADGAQTPSIENGGFYAVWLPDELSLTFSEALFALKDGHKVTRTGWNAANQWLSVSNINTADVPADRFWSPHNRDYAEQNGGTAQVPPCITIKNAQGQVQMGWIPSQSDLFANDWLIIK